MPKREYVVSITNVIKQRIGGRETVQSQAILSYMEEVLMLVEEYMKCIPVGEIAAGCVGMLIENKLCLVRMWW